MPDAEGRRACLGSREGMQRDKEFADYLLFHEYFHGETGAGLGASHQTGWTGVVAKMVEQVVGSREKRVATDDTDQHRLEPSYGGPSV